MLFTKNLSFKFSLVPFLFSTLVQAHQPNSKFGSFCIFQDNPALGEWAKDANGNIIELSLTYFPNIKCEVDEPNTLNRYTELYAVDINSLRVLINSCNSLKQRLLSNASTRENIQNLNIDLNQIDYYLSPQARVIPVGNQINNNVTLYPFAIQNQVRKNDFLFLSTYYNCR